MINEGKKNVSCNTRSVKAEKRNILRLKLFERLTTWVETGRTRDLSRDFSSDSFFVFILLGAHWTFWIYGFSVHQIWNIYSHYCLKYFSVSPFLSSLRRLNYTYAIWYYQICHWCLLYFCLVCVVLYYIFHSFTAISTRSIIFFLQCHIFW